MTLSLYIGLRFLRGVLLVLLSIGGLSAVLTLVEDIRIATSAGAPAAAALPLTLLKMPEILSETFPLVLMLGAIVAFVGLSRSSEMVIVRAAGVSALRVLGLPILMAALLGVVATTVMNPIVAVTSARADQVRAELSGQTLNVLSFSGGSLWLRQGLPQGQTVIQAAAAQDDGALLLGVRLHQFDRDNQLVARLEAETARLGDEVWILRGVRRWDLSIGPDETLGAPEELPELRLPTNLTRAQIADRFAAPDAVPIWQLPGFIAQLEQAGFSALRHKVFLQSELSRPALFIAMVLIGAGFSLRHVRFGQTGVMILMAILAGFGLYFFRDIAETLGANGDIPVVLASWSAPLAAILLALGLLLHLEDG
ncbi:LPS export ABC transporter permease LptG [Halovulum dunhuangense]|uniref:LPS export ABC transporter permease LptG n=1 Tax=Halovulum dunhuangense TaxID=1505036 RepID=A0A849L388_9RHOB|nr:LPS export ABC transporter permease LptG [Halovulum dunhuangense]NNU80806.1 LPS export ABC transporter permease LptG [Halovulum dunhuangense]